jgi:hypothetical protein
MFRHLIWTAVVVMMASGLCLAGPDDKTDPLDDANKTLKEGDKTGKTGDDQMGIDDADKTLKGEDGEDQGEKIDPLAVMKQIIDEMRDAEDALGKASAVKSLEEQKKAIKNMDDIINKTRELQEKILADMEKLFGGAGGDQDEALKLIEKIIKYARENSPEGSPSSSQQQPYQVSPHKPPDTPRNPLRTGDANQRWGDLPERMRDAINIGKSEKPLPGYDRRIAEYFKLLAGEE